MLVVVRLKEVIDMEKTRTACLHKNSCVSSSMPLCVVCPDCKAVLSVGQLFNILMQRVAALERAVEYFEEKEFK